MREDCVRASPFFVERNQLHRIIFAVRFTSCTCTQLLVLRFGIAYTVKPPNRGHFGDGPFVPCREVVLFSEVLF